MTLTQSIGNARSSLSTVSEQISVVSQNIARVNDSDATRKIANVVTVGGGGVSVAGISRTANKLLLDTYLSANASNQTQTVVNSALDRLENTVGDTDSESSPAALISKLNSALQNYSAAPQNGAVAATVVSAAQSLATALNSATQTVTNIRNQADSDIATSVSNVNNLLAQFEKLNQSIVKGTSSGADITDVLDQRDAVLKQLSTEVGIRTVSRAGGDMAIYTDSGVTLFDKTARQVTFAPTSNLSPSSVGSPIYADGVPIAGTPHTMSISSGKLAGLVDVRDNITRTYQSQLDEIARGLIEATAETDQSATPTLPAAAGLFTYGGGPAIPASGTVIAGLAGSIKINSAVDPSQGGNAQLVRDGGIAGNAAYTYNSTGAASYTDRIQQLIASLTASRSFDASSQLPQTVSVSDYAKSSVAWLEALRQSASSEAESRQTLADRASSALSRETGVSLDEEMTNLLDLERTFQASSRLINTVDNMLATLLQSIN
ncbi:flagellar hook-associated protein FlgK [Hyphomicrobium facile]|uniref:Flagellar hook-associated protein 1 n=1 Tax=Hyphomicrobium facile TaxID=51670 RepID=A0A1I7NR87_9HYPH|nr:flagellar hook-associated protein FlgK [Hyphomicrobium facile]SFV37211.1 flagellar hook-associated protein 1 FlgK [Hyphomicrobium facile]